MPSGVVPLVVTPWVVVPVVVDADVVWSLKVILLDKINFLQNCNTIFMTNFVKIANFPYAAPVVAGSVLAAFLVVVVAKVVATSPPWKSKISMSLLKSFVAISKQGVS